VITLVLFCLTIITYPPVFHEIVARGNGGRLSDMGTSVGLPAGLQTTRPEWLEVLLAHELFHRSAEQRLPENVMVSGGIAR
jgi:hypothetical protein